MRKKISDTDKLEALDIRINQLKEQKKALEKSANKKERAARTRRLIQKGAIAEKHFNCENMDIPAFEELMKNIVTINEVKDILSQ